MKRRHFGLAGVAVAKLSRELEQLLRRIIVCCCMLQLDVADAPGAGCLRTWLAGSPSYPHRTTCTVGIRTPFPSVLPFDQKPL